MHAALFKLKLFQTIGTAVNSDCSTDEEITLSELVTKSRTREKPTRGRISNRDSPVELNHCRPNRRRSGSNESRHSEEIKTRTPRENKRDASKKEEATKKLPERTKRGTFKGVLEKYFLANFKNFFLYIFITTKLLFLLCYREKQNVSKTLNFNCSGNSIHCFSSILYPYSSLSKHFFFF